MYIFWENISKFPRFLISVLIGFFLTIVSPFFELFKNSTNKNKAIIIVVIITISLLRVLKLMLGLN